MVKKINQTSRVDLISIETSRGRGIAASTLFCKGSGGDSSVQSSLRNSVIGQWFLNSSCESESPGELVKTQSLGSTVLIPRVKRLQKGIKNLYF